MLRRIVLPLHRDPKSITLYDVSHLSLFDLGQKIIINQFMEQPEVRMGIIKSIDIRRGIIYYLDCRCPLWRVMLFRIGTLLRQAGARMCEMATE